MESIAQQKRIRIDIDGRTAVVTGKDDLYQGDSYANEIVVEVLRGGEAADLTGYTASGEMQRSDEAKVPCEGNVTGNIITITLNPHCYKEAGGYMLSVKLSKSTEETTRTVLRIYGEVQRAASGPTVDISETLVDVDAVLALYEEMKTATREAEEAAENAKNLPTISTDGFWELWDAAAGEYVATLRRSMPDFTFQVMTGAPGTNAQLVQTGTAEEPVITLTIPRGDTGAVDGLDYYEGAPAELGTASPGTANGVARGDHVHPMPSANEVGALAEDGTAKDADLLGGKAPAYYIQPRNLLDNSDFTNPVNQRENITTSSASAYFVDRWKTRGKENQTSFSIDGNGMKIVDSVGDTFNGIVQSVPDGNARFAGKALTLAAKVTVRNGTFELRIAGGNTAHATTELYADEKFSESGIVCISAVMPETFSFSYFNVFVGAATKISDLTIEWVALYEGVYTAENLPPYVPKGYAAELLECQRYYYVSNGQGYGYCTGTSAARLNVPIPVEMRVLPSIDNENIKFTCHNNGTNFDAASHSIAAMVGASIRINLTSDSEFTKFTTLAGYSSTNFGFSADL